MERLINFIYEYRAFFTFLFLELLCAWLVIENNQYQSTRYFNSSNQVAAQVLGFSQGVREYFSLRTINEDLARENAELRRDLERTRQQISTPTDTARINQFDFVSAKVMANSTNLYKNFITIDKGSVDGLAPGMAVIGDAGAVGKVKSVSERYAVLISLLNVDQQISGQIKRTSHFGTVRWDGANMRYTTLQFIPRHALPVVGDTIVTSGYSAVFPQGIMVGVIREANLKPEAPFWDIRLELAQDFGRLAFVEVIKSKLKSEKDSLETITIGEPK
ncbi:MAG: rod shape-determining protein MreC [Cytophagales bacterium]|jgi:rod shape-determining protein MreC|nr:rod shape-determining protein MreC [Cytophagales bacterium]